MNDFKQLIYIELDVNTSLNMHILMLGLVGSYVKNIA